MKVNNIELMEKMDVNKAVFKLAIPTMLAMIVTLIYNMADTFFIGQTDDVFQVAALSLTLPVFLAIQAFGNLFAIGSGSYMSILLGQKNYDEAKKTNVTSLFSSIAVGILISIILVCFRESILIMLGTSMETYQYTKEYYDIIVMFSAILIVQIALSGFIRAEGATRESMIGMILGSIVNIILDPIFIFKFDMGVKGAAWATIIGNVISIIYFLNYYIKGKSVLSISYKWFKPNKKMYIEILKIGIPAAMNNILLSISFILVNRIAATYGDLVVAANGIYLRVTNIIILLVMGLAQGYQPFAGYNYGAKNYDRLMKSFKVTLINGTIMSVGFTIFYGIFARQIIGAFVQDTEVINIGVKMLHAFMTCAPFFGIQFTLMMTFQAVGKATQSLLICLGRQCLIYMPLLFILNKFVGFNGFIYAQAIADILATILAVILSISFVKEMNSMNKVSKLILD